MKKNALNDKKGFNLSKSIKLIALSGIITANLGLMAGCSFSFMDKGVKAKQQTENIEVVEENQSTEENIIGIPSESTRNETLEKTINEYFDFTDEEKEGTRYYYNYVDLDNDGKDEIFTVLMGMYTSGTGGSTALLIDKDDTGNMEVKQKLTLINTPVIISNNLTDGWKDIIVYKSGGGAKSEYVVLTNSDGQYATVNDGTPLENIDNIKGIAIIDNDIAKDLEDGTALYLK